MDFRTHLIKAWNFFIIGKYALRREIDSVNGSKVIKTSPYYGEVSYDKYTVPLHPDQDVLKFLEYPSRPSGIKVFNEQSILSLYRDKLYTIQMMLAISDSDIKDEAHSFTNLILKPLVEFIRWVHLLPASENHHHNGIGGLFSHSLDVGLLSLKNAYHSEIRPIGYQDEEVIRRSVYLYAAFICGLVHDAGKVYDVDIVSLNLSKPSKWVPGKQSLLDWALEQNVTEYEVIWRPRIHNQHNVWSAVFLERILNETCQAFLGTVSKERVYSIMLESLNFYNDGNDLLSRCVRKADYYSTGTDLNVIRDPIVGLRSSDASTRAINALKHNFKSININDYSVQPMHLIIINGDVYLNENAFADFVLADFEKSNFNFPQGVHGRNILIESLVQRGYVEPYDDERIVHYFIPGIFSEADIAEIFDKGIGELQFYNLLRLKWVGIIFDSYKIPDSVPGLFSVNPNKDYIYVDQQKRVTEYRRPIPGRTEVTKITDTIDDAITTDYVNQYVKPDVDKHAHDDITDADIVVTADSEISIPSEFKTESEPVPEIEIDALEQEEPCNSQVQLKQLHEQLMETDLPVSMLRLVDSVPYLVIDEVKKVMPDLDDSSFCDEPYFQLTYRDGSLNGHWIVRDVNDMKMVLLGNKCSGRQILNSSNIPSTTLKSLFESSMYQILKLDDGLSPGLPDDNNCMQSLELPPERLNIVNVQVAHPGDNMQSESLQNSSHELEDYYQYVQEQFTESSDDHALENLSIFEGSATEQSNPDNQNAPKPVSAGFLSNETSQSEVLTSEPELLTNSTHEADTDMPIEQCESISTPVNDSPLPPEPKMSEQIKDKSSDVKQHISPFLAQLFAPVSDVQQTAIPSHNGSATSLVGPSNESDEVSVDSTEPVSPVAQSDESSSLICLTDSDPTSEDYESVIPILEIVLRKEIEKSGQKIRTLTEVNSMLYVGCRQIEKSISFSDQAGESYASLSNFPTYRVKHRLVKNINCYQFDINRLLIASERVNLEISPLLECLLTQENK